MCPSAYINFTSIDSGLHGFKSEIRGTLLHSWETQNIHKGKKVVLLVAVTECPQATIQAHKKALCKTTRSSFISIYSEIISACPRARWLLRT